MTRDCDIDLSEAERAVERLPGSLRRGLYFLAGWLSVALGIIGIFVPLWPTTCFLLLAGWCFARSSRRAERWLYENRLFGRYLKDYREHGIISSRVRAASVLVLWTFIGLSATVFIRQPLVLVVLLLVALGVTLHLYSLPTTMPVLEESTPEAGRPY